jgi:arsenical pump membrane protein
MLALLIVLTLTCAAALSRWEASWRSAAVALAAAAVAQPLAGWQAHALVVVLAAVLPLACFLTAAIWLASFAEQAGLAERLAAGLARLAGGRMSILYLLVCTVCALLTATISLDGAVVLMVPILLALARRGEWLFRPLLVGTIAVANAFSLAVPQGNPTNLVVMARLHLSGESFVVHLFLPGLAAALVCASAQALLSRRALGRRYPPAVRDLGRPSSRELLAAGAVALAAVAACAAPWIGIPPWWPLCAVAALAYGAARALGRAVPRPAAPLRTCMQVAALLLLLAPLRAAFSGRLPGGVSIAVLLAVGAAAALAAGLVSNLPASAVFAGLLGAPSLSVYAGLAGLSVGALATRHGSVATAIALERAGNEAGELRSGAYLKLFAPAAAAATVLATALVWLPGAI